MYTQIDKGALPCEAELKAPHTRQASRIDYVSATSIKLPVVSRSSTMIHSLCAWAVQTKRSQIPATGRNRESHHRAVHPVGRAHTGTDGAVGPQTPGVACSETQDGVRTTEVGPKPENGPGFRNYCPNIEKSELFWIPTFVRFDLVQP